MSEVVAENAPVCGRKVFFVNPSYKIRTHFVDILRNQEYEVYTIDKWRDVKNYLRQNPDSICFFGIDSQLTIPAWTAMAASFENDPVLKTCILGFMTEQSFKDTGTALKILNAAHLKAGITTLGGMGGGALELVERKVQGVLDMNGAKGRRQYVRCSCFHEEAFIYLSNTDAAGKTTMFQEKVVDISSATIAVNLPTFLHGTLKKGSWLRNVIITLNGRQITTNLQVFLLKNIAQDVEIAILTYSEKLDSINRSIIKNFVIDTLQKQVNMSINGLAEDNTDYALIAQNEQYLLDLVERRKPKDDGKDNKKK